MPLATARALVPRDVGVVAVGPGLTAGGILVARYDEGSTLVYGELLVLPALTRVRGRTGWWISHAYVDSEPSLAGGRRMWGVPKDPATFAWEHGPARVRVTVTDARGAPLLAATWRAVDRAPWLPVLLAVNGTVDGADRRRFAGRGRLRMLPRTIRVEAPRAGPLAVLRLAGRRPGLAGCADVRLRAPLLLA